MVHRRPSSVVLWALALTVLLVKVNGQAEPTTTTSGLSHGRTGKTEYSAGLPVRETVWRTLIKDRGYDMSDTPNWGKGPTSVNMKFRLDRIVAIRFQRSSFEAQFVLTSAWRDQRLSWTSDDLPGMTEVTFSITDEAKDIIWRPDVVLVNVLTVTTGHLLGLVTNLANTGDVVWHKHMSCRMATTFNFRDFPFDYQVLPLVLESYKYSMGVQNTSWHPTSAITIHRMGVNHSLFKIKGIYHNTQITSYDFVGYKVKRLTVQIILVRENMSIMMKSVVPSMIVVLLSTLSYWLDPYNASPARITLCITCLLTQFAFQQSASDMVPRVSYLTWMDWFIVIMLVHNFSALLLYGVVWSYYGDDDRNVKAADIDNIARKAVPVSFVTISLIMLIIALNTDAVDPRKVPSA